MPRPPRKRRSLPVIALIVPAAAFLTAGAASFTHTEPAAATECCTELVAAPVPAAPSTGMRIVGTGPITSTVVAARAVNRDIRYMLPAGVASETGLQVETILAARAISDATVSFGMRRPSS